jgi:RNA polymerase sigma-70 factor (ECF subfamily)
MSIDSESVRRMVTDAQQGDRVAADRLIRDHQGWVRSAVYAATGRADLVDDVVQQVWTRVWERLGTLENPRRLKPWLYSVARNAAIDACVAEDRRRVFNGPLGGDAPGPDGRHRSPFGAVAGRETHEVLLRAVQALPAIYREPFVLKHLEGWRYAEIGDVLGLTVETVETRLVRARRMLREMLEGKVER